VRARVRQPVRIVMHALQSQLGDLAQTVVLDDTYHVVMLDRQR